jgi:hypothetical protein
MAAPEEQGVLAGFNVINNLFVLAKFDELTLAFYKVCRASTPIL